MKRSYPQLREGSPVSAGTFALDEAQALSKLQEFQLVSPHKYVLEFVKAAHLLGATAMEFRVSAEAMELRFDGETLREDEVNTLFSAFFSRGQTRREQALRHLTIGLNAACGPGLRELVVESAGPSPYAVCVRSREPVPQAPSPRILDGKTSTRIFVRTGLRPKVLLRFFGTLPEVDVLRRRCCYARLDIRVNEERVSRGPELPDKMLAEVDIENRVNPRIEGMPNETGRVGICKHTKLLTTHLLQHGVLIATDERPADFIGGVAIIDSPRLAVNLSQSAFVENADWHFVHDLVRAGTLRAMTEALRGFGVTDEAKIGRYAPIVLPMLGRMRLLHYKIPLSVQKNFITEVEGLRFFREATGDGDPEDYPRVSIAELRAAQGEGLNFSFQSASPGLVLPAGQRALFIPAGFLEDPRADLQLFAKTVKDVTEDIEALNKARENRSRWEASPEQGMPDKRLYPRQKQGVARGLIVTAAIGSSHSPCQLTVLKKGRVLREDVLEKSPASLSFNLQIRGEIIPNRSFDGPEVNEAYREALVQGVRLLAELIQGDFSLFSLEQKMAYLKELSDGSFKRVLMHAFQWATWPDLLEDTPFAFCSRPGLEHIRSGLDRLGPLADHAIFVAVDEKPWSLEGMYRYVRDGENKFIIFIAPGSPQTIHLTDSSFDGQLIIFATAVVEEILRNVFSLYAMSVEAYADMASSRGLRRNPETGRAEYTEEVLDFLKGGFAETAPLIELPPAAKPELELEPILERTISDPKELLARAVYAQLRAHSPLLLVSQDGIRAKLDLYSPVARHALAHFNDPVAIAFLTSSVYTALYPEGRFDTFKTLHENLTRSL